MSAVDVMRQLNWAARYWQNNGWEYFAEDYYDPNGRRYQIEYRCDYYGNRATAWLRSNPWGSNPYSYSESHLGPDGLICIGRDLYRDSSPYNLSFAVPRARFWCLGYSYLREHGLAETRRQMPEWG